jgi:hypothetical protein
LRVTPGYGKLHVGIYVAAVQDMMDLKKQQLPRSQQESLDGDDGSNPAGGNNDKDDQDEELIKGRARAEEGVVALVIQVAMCIREADFKASQKEKNLALTNWSLLRYVCLNLIGF